MKRIIILINIAVFSIALLLNYQLVLFPREGSWWNYLASFASLLVTMAATAWCVYSSGNVRRTATAACSIWIVVGIIVMLAYYGPDNGIGFASRLVSGVFVSVYNIFMQLFHVNDNMKPVCLELPYFLLFVSGLASGLYREAENKA